MRNISSNSHESFKKSKKQMLDNSPACSKSIKCSIIEKTDKSRNRKTVSEVSFSVLKHISINQLIRIQKFLAPNNVGY